MYRMRVCVVVRGGDKTKVHKEDGCGHGREGERRADRRGEGKAWSACLQFELYLLSTLTLNEAGISPSALSF